MIECLIIGDSIAVGVSQVRPECQSIAKSGINSADWNRRNLQNLRPARTLIISLGANDYRGINTAQHLRHLRSEARADRVFWLLPSDRLKPAQVQAVKTVAAEYGDTVVPRPEKDIAADGVHPTYRGYRALGELTR